MLTAITSVQTDTCREFTRQKINIFKQLIVIYYITCRYCHNLGETVCGGGDRVTLMSFMLQCEKLLQKHIPLAVDPRGGNA